jgi:lipopolysaccharide/colanic/teichoic acid biosynthesis glycosyltransferase
MRSRQPARWTLFWKRIVDVVVSTVGLLFLWPVFLVVAALIRLDSKGPVFFRQERMGRGMMPFSIFKFRSMVINAPAQGAAITAAGDGRITRLGQVLRHAKIDELPQLINVLRGDMSLVGPRPEVRHYVELFREDYEEILTVRPGITDMASLKYRNEAELLSLAADPDQEYRTRVLPDKIRLAREYARKPSLKLDISLIARTVKAVLRG